MSYLFTLMDTAFERELHVSSSIRGVQVIIDNIMAILWVNKRWLFVRDFQFIGNRIVGSGLISHLGCGKLRKVTLD